MDDAVGVDIKGYLDLWHAPGRGRNPHEVESAQGSVVMCHLAFALEHMDGNRVLVVRGRREYLTLGDRDRRVAFNQLGAHPSQRLNTQGKGRDVEEKHILDLSGEHPGLYGGADGDHFIGIDAAVRFFAEDFLDNPADGGHARHAADQDDLVDLPGGQAGIFQSAVAGILGALQQSVAQLLQFGAGKRVIEMFGSGRVRRDERKIDVGGDRAGQFTFGLFGAFFQALQGHGVFSQVDTLVAEELLRQPVNDFLIKVVAAQVGVAVGAQHLEAVVTDGQHGDVEGAAAQIIYGDFFVLLLVHAVGEGRRGGFVDNAEHFQPGDPARIFRGLTL